MQKTANERGSNLTELVKNIVLGFCKINVPYAERLDVYGSLHIRADDCDIANFMFNEHSYNSRATSPTVTSAQPIDQELGGNNGNLRDTDKNQQKHTVKTEISVSTEENHNRWQWSDPELATVQCQKSYLQPLCSTSQPVSATATSGNSVSESKYFVSGAVSDVEGRHVKCEGYDTEATVSNDQLSNDGSIEILDSDPADYRQDTGYVNDDITQSTDFKPQFLEPGEQAEANMPFSYDDFAQYDDSNVTAYQYPNMSTTNYQSKQPRAAYSAKRFKPSASSVRQNMPSTSEKTCEYCQESFISDAQLSVHFQQYHQCTMPQVNSQNRRRKTQSRRIDQTHNNAISGSMEENVVKMYKCRFCGQIFKSMDGLRNHENVKHSHSKTYRCSFCSQEFLTRQSAYTHRIKFHRLLIRKMQ